VRLEVVTVGWMTLEAAIALGAGWFAHSVLLTAFGLDSVIELLSGGILLWRLVLEASGERLEHVETAERRAAWVVAVALTLLCGYVVASAVVGFWQHDYEVTPWVGMVLALVAMVGMPVLAWRKRIVSERLKSAALRGDAACSLTCAYMAGTLFVGLGVTAIFGWWWFASVATLGFLYFLVPEARAAFVGARTGKSACGCGETDCQG
jgi:divalent metal cation (Fe/Co/Zn/Cd) transporter